MTRNGAAAAGTGSGGKERRSELLRHRSVTYTVAPSRPWSLTRFASISTTVKPLMLSPGATSYDAYKDRLRTLEILARQHFNSERVNTEKGR